jgi:hypothetical protein
MRATLAVWNEVLPSGTPVFGPFDIEDDAVAPAIALPSYRFREGTREFIVYSENSLSEQDQKAIRAKVSERIAREKQRILAMQWLATKQRRQS